MNGVPSLCSTDVDEFIGHYFPMAGPTLFIGNVGFSPDVLYFPSLLGPLPNVDMRFFHEQRPGVPAAIAAIAVQRQAHIEALAKNPVEVNGVAILADDGAPVGGRNACLQVQAWLEAKKYTDVVIDATGMSRCTSFPVVKQLYEASRQSGLRVHLLIADGCAPASQIISVSSDRGDWIHGFRAESELDDGAASLKLWVVQLSERSGVALDTMFRELGTPEEVCPVLPFPSVDPRRADALLFEHRECWQQDWMETPMSFIRAHESDPMDVFRSIGRLHDARRSALLGPGLMSQTILSPVGRRLPGIGMLLAALSYELPIFYLETVGYHVVGALDLGVEGVPSQRWHFRVDQLIPAYQQTS
jgi:hypothetical protein